MRGFQVGRVAGRSRCVPFNMARMQVAHRRDRFAATAGESK